MLPAKGFFDFFTFARSQKQKVKLKSTIRKVRHFFQLDTPIEEIYFMTLDFMRNETVIFLVKHSNI